MSAQVVDGPTHLVPWSGSGTYTTPYSAPQTLIAGGATAATTSIVVLCGAAYDALTTDPTITVTYGNVTGQGVAVSVPWVGIGSDRVHFFLCYIPLAGYNGVSDVLSITLTGSTNIPNYVLQTPFNDIGGWAYVVENVNNALNATPLSSWQAYGDTGSTGDPAAVFNFSTNVGDLVFGLGFDNLTTGHPAMFGPVPFVSGAASPTGDLGHNSGCTVSGYAVAQTTTTGLSFGNVNTGYGAGFRNSFIGFVLADPQTPGCDPNFSNVSLLLHCDGTNGSNSFPDSSPAANTVTANGSAAVSTANALFGSGSYLGIGSTTSYLTVPVVAAGPLDLRTGDWTIEGWFYVPSVSANYMIMNYDGTNLGIFVFLNGSGQMVCYVSATTFNNSGTSTYASNTWTHFAIVMYGGHLTVYLNGIGGTQTLLTVNPVLISPLYIGGTPPSYGGAFTGSLDEIRITKGLARYTSNFTPQPFAGGGFCGPPPVYYHAYGKFVPAPAVFKPIQLGNVGSIEPRVWAPAENITARSST